MEGRCLSEVAHLARLGVTLVRAGILGLLMKKAARNRCFLYFIGKSYEIKKRSARIAMRRKGILWAFLAKAGKVRYTVQKRNQKFM